MTIDEYIDLMKHILPVRKGRYNDTIQLVFAQLSSMGCFNSSEAKQVQLKIISSSSLFSELVNTSPQMTLFWDTYQWEIIEKMLVSSLLYVNEDKDTAMRVFKMNLYPVISIRLTHIAPELSYIFAKRYREIIASDEFDFFAVSSEYMFTDLLYTEILSLGHEFSHLIFDQFSWGHDIYTIYEKDFFIIMDGAIKSNVLSNPLDGHDLMLKDLVKEICKNHNSEYRKELICDIFSFSLISELIFGMDKCLSRGRSEGNLYDDVLALNDFVIRTLDSLTYVLDFWTRFGCICTTRRSVKIEDLQRDSSNLSIWKNQYYAREYLVSLYLRVTQLRDKKLYVPYDNERYLRLYNATSEMYSVLMRFTDKDWAEIIVEFNNLLHQRIPSQDLIEARNSHLGI